MIIKVCQFRAHDDHGNPLVQIFNPGNIDSANRFFNRGLTKTSAPLLPSVQRYLEGLRPDPRRIVALVNALGASEYWGQNINGDIFFESSLIHDGPQYGHKTFLNAHLFAHHANKDPNKSFGDIAVADYNTLMHRVELVIVIDRLRAERLGAQAVVDKMDKGIFQDLSMGTKVPFDRCTLCCDTKKFEKAKASFNPRIHENIAKAVLAWHSRDPIRGLSVTRHDYCNHLKNQLNKILPSGLKIGAINDYPRFFDLSFVFIGADKTAKVMMKLAESGKSVPSWQVAQELGYDMEDSMEKAASVQVPRGVSWVRDRLREKQASHHKRSEITKEVVPSQFGSAAIPLDHETDLPNRVLDLLGSSDLSEALSTPSVMGMLLKPREFQRITIIRLGNRGLADDLDQHGHVFSPVDEVDSSVPVHPDRFSPSLRDLLLPHLEERSCLEPVIRRRIVRITISGTPSSVEHAPSCPIHGPLLDKISAAYNSYLDQAVNCMLNAEPIICSDAKLWSQVTSLGVGDGFSKEAGINPAIVLGTAGAGYLISKMLDYQRQRAMMGQASFPGPVTNLIAEHPKSMAMLGALVGLRAQGARIPPQVTEKLKQLGANLLK